MTPLFYKKNITCPKKVGFLNFLTLYAGFFVVQKKIVGKRTRVISFCFFGKNAKKKKKSDGYFFGTVFQKRVFFRLTFIHPVGKKQIDWFLDFEIFHSQKKIKN